MANPYDGVQANRRGNKQANPGLNGIDAARENVMQGFINRGRPPGLPPAGGGMIASPPSGAPYNPMRPSPPTGTPWGGPSAPPDFGGMIDGLRGMPPGGAPYNPMHTSPPSGAPFNPPPPMGGPYGGINPGGMYDQPAQPPMHGMPLPAPYRGPGVSPVPPQGGMQEWGPQTPYNPMHPSAPGGAPFGPPPGGGMTPNPLPAPYQPIRRPPAQAAPQAPFPKRPVNNGGGWGG